MNNLNRIIIWGFILIFAGCSDTSQNYEAPPLEIKTAEPASDELIASLRKMKYTDFKIIHVDNLGEFTASKTDREKGSAKLQMMGAQLQHTEWWAGLPLPSKATDHPFYLGSSSYPYNHQDYRLETYVNLPASRVAIGLGGRSTDDNFSNSGITGVSIYSDFTLGSNKQLYKNNTSNLETNFSLPTYAAQDVVIGAGIRVSYGNLRGMWIYTVPYDETTHKIDIQSPSDVTVYVYKAGPEGNLTQEVELRSWDVYGSISKVQKTFIVGFGGGTHYSNATRIGLHFAELSEI